MPARSKKQQELFGAELSRRRTGEKPQLDASTEVVEEFASTKTTQLPTRVKKGRKNG